MSVIKSSAAAAAERKARSQAIDNQEYDDVTYECNLSLVLLQIGLQINEIETSYIIIHKIYFYFANFQIWRPSAVA